MGKKLDENGLAHLVGKIKDAMAMFPILTVQVVSGSVVTAVCGTERVIGTSVDGSVDLKLPVYGDWSVSAAKGGETTSSVTIAVNVSGRYRVHLYFGQIYGVEWNKSSSSEWTRTDDAMLFTDPVPYYSGATSYSSPFDELYPWAEMTIENDAVAGKMVKIPKYWYKWTNTSGAMKLQISNHEEPGFHISPAHAARFSGDIVKDYVYVGRYHCGSNYKSQSGNMPIAYISRNAARGNIHALGERYWQYDFAMFWTIAMLYLVEFADWNSQSLIGKGCGDNLEKGVVGYTDNMPYHTGTILSFRASYGYSTQYRYIEGLWDNVSDWVDGIYFNGNSVYCIKNPSQFSDNANGVLVGTRTMNNGTTTDFFNTTEAGYEYAMYPSAAHTSFINAYVNDITYNDADAKCLYTGGGYVQGNEYGMFFFDAEATAETRLQTVGCRLQKI